ncbi:MAG: N-acyl homoserine lactonase family protein [Ktedonobacteraceae bacterium]|nr:N-acyl homoserine lactonase family protein [Ktedonobacteraceae bacterium]
MTTSTSAPLRLYLMRVANMPPVNIPVPCYLIQTGDGKNILIDSGLPPGVTEGPPGMPAPTIEKNVIEQLAIIGLQPAAIDMLICTHFDQDHAGHHNAFPNAELIVQRQHYEVASGGHARFAGSRAYWDVPASRYRQVDGDTELLPGLTLIETSGHVPGHQSVLVRLPHTGPVLLTIDAVTMQEHFTPDRPTERFDADEEGTRASTRKLLDIAQREHVALVIFGHDGPQWQTLKKLPEFYD